MIRLLRKRGVLDDDAYDNFADDEPLLAGMTSASIMGLVSTGDRAERRVRHTKTRTTQMELGGGIATLTGIVVLVLAPVPPLDLFQPKKSTSYKSNPEFSFRPLLSPGLSGLGLDVTF